MAAQNVLVKDLQGVETLGALYVHILYPTLSVSLNNVVIAEPFLQPIKRVH